MWTESGLRLALQSYMLTPDRTHCVKSFNTLLLTKTKAPFSKYTYTHTLPGNRPEVAAPMSMSSTARAFSARTIAAGTVHSHSFVGDKVWK